MVDPVCYVCGREDPSVFPVRVALKAERIGLKSEDSRSKSVDLFVCGACWGAAALTTLAGCARA